MHWHYLKCPCTIWIDQYERQERCLTSLISLGKLCLAPKCYEFHALTLYKTVDRLLLFHAFVASCRSCLVWETLLDITSRCSSLVVVLSFLFCLLFEVMIELSLHNLRHFLLIVVTVSVITVFLSLQRLLSCKTPFLSSSLFVSPRLSSSLFLFLPLEMISPSSTFRPFVCRSNSQILCLFLSVPFRCHLISSSLV